MCILQEELEFNIDINNIRPGNTQDLVDRYILRGALTPSNTFIRREIFGGTSERGILTLSFRLRCTQNYFGSDCNTYCVPTERFTCDPTNGNIVCREGYQDKATNCSVCVPATGCSKEILAHAHCMKAVHMTTRLYYLA